MVRPLHSLLLFPRCHHFSPTRIKENSGWLFSCNVDTPKRMRGSRGKTFGWPPGRQVSKHSQEQKFNFCDGCRAYGPAEGCWGRAATNEKAPEAETRNEKPPTKKTRNGVQQVDSEFASAPDAGGFDSAFHIRNPGAVAGIAEFVDETGPGASYAFKTALILFQFSYVEFRLLLKRESEKNFRAFAV